MEASDSIQPLTGNLFFIQGPDQGCVSVCNPFPGIGPFQEKYLPDTAIRNASQEAVIPKIPGHPVPSGKFAPDQDVHTIQRGETHADH
jgi:hypothetical protein